MSASARVDASTGSSFLSSLLAVTDRHLLSPRACATPLICFHPQSSEDFIL